MVRQFTLEYWTDEGWYIGRLKQVPGVFSQGKTLAELEKNIRDAYRLMMAEEEESARPHAGIIKTKEVRIAV
jgi:predicted RNase H-like HicB family nuclease